MKEDDTSDENPLLLRRNSVQQLFDGYEYDNSQPIRKELVQSHILYWLARIFTIWLFLKGKLNFF